MKASESVVFANGEVGPLTTAGTFRYEVEKAENDQYGNIVTTVKSFGQKTRPCPEPEIIALRALMINQAREVFC